MTEHAADTTRSVTDLLARTRQVENPMELLDICSEGGAPLLERDPRLPRRILRLANEDEDSDRADAARTEMARRYPDSLISGDLTWLARLGLKAQAERLILRVLQSGETSGWVKARMVTLYHKTPNGPDDLTRAFEQYPSDIQKDPEFAAAYVRALVEERRVKDAHAVVDAHPSLRDNSGGPGVFLPDPEGQVGFGTFVCGSPDHPVHQRQAIFRQLGSQDEIDGWRLLAPGISYRAGTSNTAVVFYDGPQDARLSLPLHDLMEVCQSLGIGQICPAKRPDRNFGGLGPWTGLPGETFTLLSERLSAIGVERTATCGSSQNGMAAMIAAAEGGAEGAFVMPALSYFPDPAIRPSDLAPEIVARERRHLSAKVLDLRPYLANATTLIHAHLPTGSAFDCGQIDHIGDYPHLTVIKHPYENHSIRRHLHESGALGPAFKEFLQALGRIPVQS